MEEFQNRLQGFKGVHVFWIRNSIGRSLIQQFERFGLSPLGFSKECSICGDGGFVRVNQLECSLRYAETNYKTVEEESRALGSLKIKIN